MIDAPYSNGQDGFSVDNRFILPILHQDKGQNMRYFILFCLMLFSLYGEVTLAKEKDCTDFVMMGIGPQPNPQECLKGDVIMAPYKRVVELCDFNKAITCNNAETNLLCYCVYLGTEREKR